MQNKVRMYMIITWVSILSILFMGASLNVTNQKLSWERSGVHASIVHTETSAFDGEFTSALSTAQLVFDYLDDIDYVEDYWDLTGTVLSPTRAGDDITTTGEIRVGADQGDYDIQTADDVFAGDNITATDDVIAGTAASAGAIKIGDGSTNYITINTPALSSDWELTLPDNGGLALQFLQTDGNGNTSWATPTDIDTDNMAICWDDIQPTQIVSGGVTTVVAPHCIPLTGSATYIGVYIITWDEDPGNIDTMTVTLYVDGVAKDTFTTNTGNTGSAGGAISEALTQGHYCEIKAQITTVVGAPDDIQIQTAICNVEIN